ncbi:T9SS type A sorting domain-containing protein [bacterium]|nr:T9SS type A sorting domain-containing protein [bacterium]
MRRMLRVVLSVALILCVAAGVLAQDANNVVLQGRWAYGYVNAVTVTSGANAFVAAGGYLEIWDISTPGTPAFVSHLAMPKPLLDIAVNGTDVYAVDGDSLYSIDVSTITDPVRNDAYYTKTAAGDGYASSVVFYANTAQGRDYVGIANGVKGIMVIDVDDPSALTYAGSDITPGGYAVDVGYFTNTATDEYLYACFVDSDVATNNFLRIYDVDFTNPGEIDEIGNWGFTEYPLAVDFITAGGADYAVIADSTRLYTVDITDPTACAGSDSLTISSNVRDVVIGYDGANYYAFLAITDGATTDVGRVLVDDPTDIQTGGLVDDFASDGTAIRLAFDPTADDVYVATGLGGLQSYLFDLSGETADILNADGDDGDDAGTNYYGAGTLNDIVAADMNTVYVTDIDDGIKKIEDTGTWDVTAQNNTDFTANAFGLDLDGDTLYVASGGVGVQLFDVADITTQVDVYNTDGQAYGVYVLNGYAYVADGSNGLVILDVDAAGGIDEVGHVSTNMILQSGDIARDVFVYGNYAYVAVGFGGLYVVDVTSKTAPTVVRSIAMDGEDVLAVSGDALGQYVYVANGEYGLEIIDISSPTTASVVYTFNTSGSVKDVKVYQNYAYIADGTGGFRVLNVYDPTTPTEEGYYDTGGDAQGVYMLSHEHVYVADGNNGMYEFDNVLAHNVHFVSPTYTITDPTGRSIPVVIQNAQILGNDALESGDEIAIFDGHQRVVGRAVYQGRFPLTITVWMRYYDANSSTTLPGAYEGNHMIFMIWNKSTDEVLGAFPTYTTGNGIFSDTQLLTVVNPLTAYDLSGAAPVAPTGSYMTVIVYDNITVNGEAIEAGDEIQVYDGSTLVGAIRYNNAAVQIPVWLAMTIPPSNEVLPGANRDHYMSFMIYDSSAGTTNPTTATFAEGTTGKFGQDEAVVTQLASYTTLVQTITLEPAKLNLISFNVDPVSDYDQEISAMLGDVTGGVAVCQDDEGNYFMPGADIDQIGMVNLSKGYQVYHDEVTAQTIDNEGNRLVPNEMSISLTPTRFYMVGYPYQGTHDAADVFSSLGTSLIVLQDESDGSYWIPAYNINDIDKNGGLQPGRGYKLYVDATVTFTYPGLPDATPKAIAETPGEKQQVRHFTYHESGMGYAVVVTGSAMDLTVGDEIGLFAGDRCVGARTFEGAYPFAVSAWQGLNLNDLNIPGFAPGDPIIARVWDAETGHEFPVPVMTEENQAVYGSGAMAVISLGEAEEQDLMPSEFGMDQNYPNPFNPETTIKYRLPESGSIKIVVYNSVGQEIRTLVDGVKEAGHYAVTWDGMNDQGVKVASGVYVVRLKAGSYSKNIKMLFMQ